MKRRTLKFQEDPEFDKFIAKMNGSLETALSIEKVDIVNEMSSKDKSIISDQAVQSPSPLTPISTEQIGLENSVSLAENYQLVVPINQTNEPINEDSKDSVNSTILRPVISNKSSMRKKLKSRDQDSVKELETYLLNLPKANISGRSFAKEELQIRLPHELSKILRYIPQYFHLDNTVIRLDDLAAYLLNEFVAQHVSAIKYMGQEVTRIKITQYQEKLKEADDFETVFNRFS